MREIILGYCATGLNPQWNVEMQLNQDPLYCGIIMLWEQVFACIMPGKDALRLTDKVSCLLLQRLLQLNWDYHSNLSTNFLYKIKLLAFSHR